jgi:hypothetical protein
MNEASWLFGSGGFGFGFSGLDGGFMRLRRLGWRSRERAGRDACVTSGALQGREFGFVAGENAIDPLFVEGQRCKFPGMGEPGFGAGNELVLRLGRYVSATKNLIFDLASAG